MKISKQRIFVSLIAIFIIIFSLGFRSTVSFADEACSLNHAVYTPHVLHESGMKRYELTINRNKEYIAPTGVELNFSLNTLTLDGKELSSTNLSYRHDGGGEPVLTLDQKSKSSKFYSSPIFSLGKDFYSAPFSENVAPFAIFIPDLYKMFREQNFWKNADIKYFKGVEMSEDVVPDKFIEIVWTLNNCKN